MDKPWHIYAMEFYTTTQKSKHVIHGWISKTSYAEWKKSDTIQKGKYCLIQFIESICSSRPAKWTYYIKVRIEVTSGGGEKVLARKPGKLELFYTFIWVAVTWRYTNVRIIELYT